MESWKKTAANDNAGKRSSYKDFGAPSSHLSPSPVSGEKKYMFHDKKASALKRHAVYDRDNDSTHIAPGTLDYWKGRTDSHGKQAYASLKRLHDFAKKMKTRMSLKVIKKDEKD